MEANKRTYRAKAREWGLGETGTGKEQVAVEFTILTEGATEQGLVWYGYFTEATLERTIESLRHMGWKGDDPSDGLPGLDANEVDIVVENEEFEGRTYAKVQWVNRPGGLAIKAPLAPEKAKAFGAAMRERIRAIDASKGERKAAQPKAANGSAGAAPAGQKQMTEKDVPF